MSHQSQIALFLVVGVTVLFARQDSISGDPQAGSGIDGAEFDGWDPILKEVIELPAEDLAKRCEFGLRIYRNNLAFGGSRLVAITNDFKSKDSYRPVYSYNIQVEASFDGKSWNLDHRRFNLRSLDDRATELNREISESELWRLKDQDQIANFRPDVRDGYSVQVELFSRGKSKRLTYSNPDVYPQWENVQFLRELERFTKHLKFPLRFNEQEAANTQKSSAPDAKETEQDADDQLPARAESKAE